MNPTTPFHVLIIEDSPEDRADLRQMLLRGSQRHYRFTEVETGGAGLRAVREKAGAPPDFVLLDFNLPDMNALDVLKDLCAGAALPPCPVVVVTGANSNLGGDVLRAGAQDYIEKEWITPGSLTRTVENAVERFALVMARNEAQLALEASEARLKVAAEAGRVGIWDWNLVNDTLFWDDAMFSLYGARREDFSGTYAAWAILLHPEDRAASEAAAQDAVAGRKDYPIEFRVIWPDGSVHHLEAHGRVFRDEAGKPMRMIGTSVDVTARKLRERNLVFLADMQKLFAPLTSATEIMRAVGERIAEHLGLFHCTLAEVDEAADTCTVLHDHQAPGTQNLAGDYRLSDFYPEEERRMLASGAPLVIANVRDDGRTLARAEYFEALGIRALVNAGYLSGGRWRFVLHASRAEPYAWPAEEVELLTELAARIYVRVERARAEEALRDSEEFNRTVLESSPDCLKVIAADGTVLSLNENGCNLLRLADPSVLVGKKWWSFWPEESRALVENAVVRAGRGEMVRFEREGPIATGEVKWWDVEVSPVRDPDGSVSRILAVSRDITERKRAEEALREKSHFLQRISEVTPGVLHVFDLEERRAVFINRSVASMLGFSPEEVAAMGTEVVPSLMHPDDLPRFAQHLGRIATLADGEVADFEHRMRDQAGDWHWFHSHDAVFARDAAGGARQLIGVATEITEHKRAEEKLRHNEYRLRLTLEAAATGLWDWDVQTNVVTWSAESYPIHGLKEGEFDGTADGFDRVLHPDDRSRVWATVRAAVDGRTKYSCEFRIIRPGGEVRWVANTGRAVYEHGHAVKMVGTITDITERKRAEEAVARLAAIVESSHDALFGEDLDGIITSWNPGAEQIFGYRAEEIVGTSIMRLIPADRQAAEYELQRQIAAGECGGTLEAIRLTKDGREFPASITIAPLKDAAGKVIGASRVLRDITDRTRAEEALLQNAALFTTLIAQAPMGTYVVDSEFRIQQINAEALPAFGTVHPLIGRDFQEVVEILWGSEVGGPILSVFRNTLENGESYVSPPFTKMRHDVGIVQTYEWQTQRVTLPDGEMGVVCYFHEVTERARATEALRASQERMRLAAEATGVGIWEWNVVTKEVHWDAVMFTIYGITPTPDGVVQYSDWSGAVLPEDLSENEAILHNTVSQCGQSTRSFRIRRRNDGECRHIEAGETVRVDAAGQADIVVGTNLDVTERVQAEQAILEAAEKAVAANEAKDRFLAALSHELRTPLTPVLLVSGLRAKSKELSEDLREDFEMIHRNVVLEAQLIDDLLDVSRIQQGKMRFDFKIVDVHEAITRALEMLFSEVEEKGIVVRQELHATPAMIEADPTRLRQVMVNLFRNAVKFTPQGGTITVRTARAPDALQISVADTGAGIAAEDIERIFEAFEQVDQQQKNEYRSLGLGLAISASIVAAHRGRIWAESPGRDQGATFHVRFPC